MPPDLSSATVLQDAVLKYLSSFKEAAAVGSQALWDLFNECQLPRPRARP